MTENSRDFSKETNVLATGADPVLFQAYDPDPDSGLNVRIWIRILGDVKPTEIV